MSEVMEYPHAVSAGSPEPGPTPAPTPTPPPGPTPPKVDAITPDAPRTEAERLDPQPEGPITLSTGTIIDVAPLRLRETMKLLRIITHGAGGAIGGLFDLNTEDGDAFAQQLVMVLLMSLPDAENESVDFLQTMCIPHPLSGTEVERQTQLDLLKAELDNPGLEDVVSIVEAVIRRESEDIRALGKRLAAALNLASRIEEVNSSNAATPKA